MLSTRTATATSIALLLAACSPEAAPPAPETAATQTSASPYPADYAALREGARSFAADVSKAEQQGRAMPGDTGYGPYFDTLDCTLPDAEPIERSPQEARLETLAHDAMVLETRLQAYGYAPEVWQEPVQRWQLAALPLVSAPDVPAFEDPRADSFDQQLSSLHESLTAELEANRQRLQPDSLPIRREGGCGAAEAPVLVKADPPDGRIWLTTRFTFDVCRAKKLDPWDRNACRWAEMDPTREAFLSGTYMVQGKWPNGASVRTNRQIVSDDPEQAITLTIRPG